MPNTRNAQLGIAMISSNLSNLTYWIDVLNVSVHGFVTLEQVEVSLYHDTIMCSRSATPLLKHRRQKVTTHRLLAGTAMT